MEKIAQIEKTENTRKNANNIFLMMISPDAALKAAALRLHPKCAALKAAALLANANCRSLGQDRLSG